MTSGKRHSLSEPQIREVARLFAVLAQPARLKLLGALLDRPRTVTELMAATGLRQGNASRHLAMLWAARLVSRTRDGRFARYAIADPRLFDLCALMCSHAEEQALTRLRALAPGKIRRPRR
jgi:ArsR family transcriptional regulator